MIQTGVQLKTFVTSLNAEAAIDDTLLANLVETARAIIEEERPWMVLRKTDSTKSITTGSTWETAIDLSTITDLSRFYGEHPVRLFDGNERIQYYQLVPWDRRLEYKNSSNTCVYDANSKNLYLNGVVPYNGSLYINYVSTSTAIDLSSDAEVWSIFPSRFLPVLGFYAVGIYKGAVDYDSINRQMLPENREALNALKTAMESWDNQLQLSEIEFNDPTNLYSFPRDRAINRYDD